MLYSWMFEVNYLLNNITFSSLVCELLVSVGYLYRRIKLRNEECREVNKFKAGKHLFNRNLTIFRQDVRTHRQIILIITFFFFYI